MPPSCIPTLAGSANLQQTNKRNIWRCLKAAWTSRWQSIGERGGYPFIVFTLNTNSSLFLYRSKMKLPKAWIINWHCLPFLAKVPDAVYLLVAQGRFMSSSYFISTVKWDPLNGNVYLNGFHRGVGKKGSNWFTKGPYLLSNFTSFALTWTARVLDGVVLPRL